MSASSTLTPVPPPPPQASTPLSSVKRYQSPFAANGSSSPLLKTPIDFLLNKYQIDSYTYCQYLGKGSIQQRERCIRVHYYNQYLYLCSSTNVMRVKLTASMSNANVDQQQQHDTSNSNASSSAQQPIFQVENVIQNFATPIDVSFVDNYFATFRTTVVPGVARLTLYNLETCSKFALNTTSSMLHYHVLLDTIGTNTNSNNNDVFDTNNIHQVQVFKKLQASVEGDSSSSSSNSVPLLLLCIVQYSGKITIFQQVEWQHLSQQDRQKYHDTFMQQQIVHQQQQQHASLKITPTTKVFIRVSEFTASDSMPLNSKQFKQLQLQQQQPNNDNHYNNQVNLEENNQDYEEENEYKYNTVPLLPYKSDLGTIAYSATNNTLVICYKYPLMENLTLSSVYSELNGVLVTDLNGHVIKHVSVSSNNSINNSATAIDSIFDVASPVPSAALTSAFATTNTAADNYYNTFIISGGGNDEATTGSTSTSTSSIVKSLFCFNTPYLYQQAQASPSLKMNKLMILGGRSRNARCIMHLDIDFDYTWKTHKLVGSKQQQLPVTSSEYDYSIVNMGFNSGGNVALVEYCITTSEFKIYMLNMWKSATGLMSKLEDARSKGKFIDCEIKFY